MNVASDIQCVCGTVSCGHMIKQAVTARSAIGLECKQYVDQKQLGKDFFLSWITTD